MIPQFKIALTKEGSYYMPPIPMEDDPYHRNKVASDEGGQKLPFSVDHPYLNATVRTYSPTMKGMLGGGAGGALAGLGAAALMGKSKGLGAAIGAGAGAYLGTLGGSVKGTVDVLKEHHADVKSLEAQGANLPSSVKHPYMLGNLAGPLAFPIHHSAKKKVQFPGETKSASWEEAVYAVKDEAFLSPFEAFQKSANLMGAGIGSAVGAGVGAIAGALKKDENGNRGGLGGALKGGLGGAALGAGAGLAATHGPAAMSVLKQKAAPMMASAQQKMAPTMATMKQHAQGAMDAIKSKMPQAAPPVAVQP